MNIQNRNLPDLTNFCNSVQYSLKNPKLSKDILTFTKTINGLQALFHFNATTNKISLFFDLHIIKQTSIYLEPVFLKKVFREYQSEVISEEEDYFGYSGFNLKFSLDASKNNNVLTSLLKDFDNIVRVAGKWTMAGILKMLHGTSVKNLHFSPNKKDLICFQNKGL
jgi:hypothetical protein